MKYAAVIEYIPDAEKVQVNDAELSERIVYQAQNYGMSPQDYIQRVQEAGQLPAVYADARRGKALAAVLREAKVSDESGNTVDLEEVLGPLAPKATVAAE